MSLHVEITRRCNLQCPHCMKGDAQSVDIDKSVIDRLLDDTVLIGRLHITGGEPFLDFDKVTYLIEEIIKRNIPVNNIIFTTNGLLIDESCKRTFSMMFKCLKAKHEYVLKKEVPDEWIKNKIIVRISADDYHGTDTDTLYKKAVQAIGEYADVVLYGGGNMTKTIGRGKNVEHAAIPPEVHRTRIQVHGGGRKAMCPLVTNQLAKKETNNYLICCDLMLTANGRLIQLFDCDYMTEDTDKYTVYDFKKDDSLIDAVDKYNVGKPFCKSIEKQDLEVEDVNELYFNEKVYKHLETVKNDDRYKIGNMKVSEIALLEYDGATAAEKVADRMSKDRRLTVGEIFAREWFSDDEQCRKIKIAYPYLTREEVIKFAKSDPDGKIRLATENGKRKVKDDLNEHLKGNKRLYRMFDKLKKLLLDGVSGDELYLLYQANYKVSSIDQGALPFDKKGLIDFLKSDYQYNEWLAVRGFFLNRVIKCLDNVNLNKSSFLKSEQCTVDNFKSILGENIAVFKVWHELTDSTFKEQYQVDKDDSYCRVISGSEGMLTELFDIMIRCDGGLKKLVNDIDDHFKRPQTYPNIKLSFLDQIRIVKAGKMLKQVNEIMKGR